MFGVIPSFALVGPLALLAMLFPGVFAAVTYLWKQWRAFGIAACSVSTLTLLHWLMRGWLPNEVWAGAVGLQLICNGVVLLAMVWAVCRFNRSRMSIRAWLGLGMILMLFTLLRITASITIDWIASLVKLDSPLFMAMWVVMGLLIGLIHSCFHRLTKFVEPIFSSEFIALAAMLSMGVTVCLTVWPTDHQDSELPSSNQIQSETIWESSDWTEVLSSIAIDEQGLWFGVGRLSAFNHRGGVVSLHHDGTERWQFDAEGMMRPVYSTPRIVNDTLVVGEGLHQDQQCRLFRLNAVIGTEFGTLLTTASHIEGSPTIDDEGTIYVAAGADGIYAVHDNRILWHVDPGWHSDTSLTLHQGKIFGGSGYDHRELFALDADDGAIVWKVPIELRSFGTPLIVGDHVVFGLGSGNLGEDDASPSWGLLVCLQQSTGKEVWRCELPGAVHTPLLLHEGRIVATARNGKVFAVDVASGQLVWQRSLTSTVTTGAVLLQNENQSVLAIVTQQGWVFGLDPHDGQIAWRHDLAQDPDTMVEVFSTPTMAWERDDTLLIGGRLRYRYNGEASAVVFQLRVGS